MGYFCIAPFTNVSITPTGVSKPCCLYRGLNDIRDPIDAFYSEEWSSLRNRMLRNEFIKECDSCNHTDTTVGFYKNEYPSYRDWFNNRYEYDGTYDIKFDDGERKRGVKTSEIKGGKDYEDESYY